MEGNNSVEDLLDLQEQAEKTKLLELKQRISLQNRDRICKLVDVKNEEIKDLERKIEELKQNVNDAEELHEKIKQEIQDHEPRSEDDESESDETSKEDSESDESSEEDDESDESSEEDEAEAILHKKRNEIHDIMTDMKKTLTTLKDGITTLQKLRRNENINELYMEETKCDEESAESVINRIAALKRGTKCLEETESEDLRRQKLDLKREKEQLYEQLNEAELSLFQYDKEELRSTDRNRIKFVQHDLISKKDDLHKETFELKGEEKRLNDTNECLESRQEIIRNYLLKNYHVEELLKQQDESIPLMEEQHCKELEELDKELAKLKTCTSKELKEILSVIERVEEAQKEVKISETQLSIARNKQRVMEHEMCALKCQIEKLHQDINRAKKKIPSQYEKEQINKEITRWKNETEVQFHQKVELKEKTQLLMKEVRKAATKAQEKRKELCYLNILETELRESLTENYQNTIGMLEDNGKILVSAEDCLKKQIDCLEIENLALDIKLSCIDTE